MVRYSLVQVTIRNAPNGLVIRGFGRQSRQLSRRRTRALQDVQSFSQQIAGLSALTHFASECTINRKDYPSREQRQWLGDVTVENLVGHAAFGPSIAPLTAKFLQQVAESQRPTVLAQMLARAITKPTASHSGSGRCNGSSRPKITGCIPPIARPSMRYSVDPESARLVENFIGASGLAADVPYWHFMDWAGLDARAKQAIENAQLAGSFRSAALLRACSGLGEESGRVRAEGQYHCSCPRSSRHWDADRTRLCRWRRSCERRSNSRAYRSMPNAAIALWGSSTPDRIGDALDGILGHARASHLPPRADRSHR